MQKTADLFIINDSEIYDIDVNLKIVYVKTRDQQKSNVIKCQSEIHHNSPYFAYASIPVIYDEEICNDFIEVKCNNNTQAYSLNNSVITAISNISSDDFENKILACISPTKNELDSDINLLLKLILSKNEFTKKIGERFKSCENFSLQWDSDLQLKYLLFTFKNNGSLYHPFYYFDYTTKLLEYVRREEIKCNSHMSPFLKKFVLLVLNYYRSDCLFGPHTALSYYIYNKFNIKTRCLPIDLTFDDEYHNSEDFKFMNFTFIENTISITTQLALIWGYQSSCHEYFMEFVKNLNIRNQFTETLPIMEMRLRESDGASEASMKNFTEFSRQFFPNPIGAHPLSNQLDNQISLNFLHGLMRIRPLVAFPKDSKEVVKFSLPSSMLANVSIDEYLKYPENARYDFSNPQITYFRSNVKKFYINMVMENEKKEIMFALPEAIKKYIKDYSQQMNIVKGADDLINNLLKNNIIDKSNKSLNHQITNIQNGIKDFMSKQINDKELIKSKDYLITIIQIIKDNNNDNSEIKVAIDLLSQFTKAAEDNLLKTIEYINSLKERLKLFDEFIDNPTKLDELISKKDHYDLIMNTKIDQFSQVKPDIHQLKEPIITSFYGKTSLFITQFTDKYDFTKVDLHNLLSISVSKKNPYLVFEKGILYRGYNIKNKSGLDEKNQNESIIILAARDILSVEVPKTVIRISESAFESCQYLEKVTFEKGSLLKKIDDSAFFNCPKLKYVNFENAIFLEEIGSNAFQYSGINEITFPDKSSLKIVGEFSFSWCESLKKVKFLSNKDLSIKSYAFYNSGVEEVKFSNDSYIDSIYDYAFAKTNIEEISLPKSLNYIGAYAFSECCNLKSIKIPPKVGYILPLIVYESENVKKFEIDTDDNNDSYLYIPSFSYEVKIVGSSPSKLGNDTLFIKSKPEKNDESKKQNDCISNVSPDRDFKKDPLYKRAKEISEGAFINSTINEFSENLFDGKQNKISIISRLSFAYMVKLTKADLRKTNIKVIPEYCFFHSLELEEVLLPKSVQKINRFAFAYTKLMRINLPELTSLNEICDYAFYNTKIRHLFIPPSVTYIGSHFYSVSTYTINKESESYVGEEEEEEAEFLDDEDEIIEEGNEDPNELMLKKYKPEIVKKCQLTFLPSSKLKRIESYAFYHSSLQSVILPSSLKYIGCYAFAESEISNLTIPKNVRRIPDGAFYNSKLNILEYEDINSINYIGSYAFTGSEMSEYVAPPNISIIPDDYFADSKCNDFQFNKSLKIHKIGKNAFNFPNLVVLLPLTATEFCDDSFKYENKDFIGEKTDERIKDFIEFNDYDEIIFDSNESINVNHKGHVYNPYLIAKKYENEDKPTGGEQTRIKDILYSNVRIESMYSSDKKFKSTLEELKKNSQMQKRAAILLYYEIASKSITHIVITCSDTKNDILSYLFGIDEIDNSIKDKFKEFAKDFQPYFIHEEDVCIFEDFINYDPLAEKYKLNPEYPPQLLLEEVNSLCKVLNPKISKKPGLLPASGASEEFLFGLTSLPIISYAYICNKFTSKMPDAEKYKFKLNNSERFINLRLVEKDEFFELFIVYDKETNSVISKEFLTSEKLLSNKWFRVYAYKNARVAKDDFYKKIAVTYNTSQNFSLRRILDQILRGKLPIGQQPNYNFLKIRCLAAYLRAFMDCESENYVLDDISSHTLFVENEIIQFIFIPSSGQEFNVKKELMRLWILIYELFSNENVDELLLNLDSFVKKVNENAKNDSQNKEIELKKLEVKKNNLQELALLDKVMKNELESFIKNISDLASNLEKTLKTYKAKGGNKKPSVDEKCVFKFLFNRFYEIITTQANCPSDKNTSQSKDFIDSAKCLIDYINHLRDDNKKLDINTINIP